MLQRYDEFYQEWQRNNPDNPEPPPNVVDELFDKVILNTATEKGLFKWFDDKAYDVEGKGADFARQAQNDQSIIQGWEKIQNIRKQKGLAPLSTSTRLQYLTEMRENQKGGIIANVGKAAAQVYKDRALLNSPRPTSNGSQIPQTADFSPIRVGWKKRGYKYWRETQSYANQYGLDATVLSMQQGAESAYRPHAKSRDKNGKMIAGGLTQFIPSTARLYGVRYGSTKSAITL